MAQCWWRFYKKVKKDQPVVGSYETTTATVKRIAPASIFLTKSVPLVANTSCSSFGSHCSNISQLLKKKLLWTLFNFWTSILSQSLQSSLKNNNGTTKTGPTASLLLSIRWVFKPLDFKTFNYLDTSFIFIFLSSVQCVTSSAFKVMIIKVFNRYAGSLSTTLSPISTLTSVGEGEGEKKRRKTSIVRVGGGNFLRGKRRRKILSKSRGTVPGRSSPR